MIYLVYGAAAAVLTFVFCRKQGQPKWWAGLALIFPLAVVPMMVRAKMKRRTLFVTLLVVSFLSVLAAEAFLYVGRKANSRESVPPIIKKVTQLNQDVKQTTIDIYKASGKLHSISMVQSRITDIKSSIQVIENLRELVERNHAAIGTLMEFITDHQAYFHRKNLSWVLNIKAFYSDYYVVQHRNSQAQYLSAFEVLLKYTFENFQNIMELKSQRHMKSYDAYYLRYRRAADAYNRFNRKRIAFQKDFALTYPEVRPFLPGSHHQEPFRFWDEFQF